MGKRGERVKSIEELEELIDSINDKDIFAPGLMRRLLGLDGEMAKKIPDFEKERLANILFRNEKISITELEILGFVVKKS